MGGFSEMWQVGAEFVSVAYKAKGKVGTCILL